MVINDLVQPVIGKLRQRTEYAATAPYYIAQTILDLTENIEFEELKVTGPLANFVPNIAEYPIKGYDINGITGNPFINAEDHRITFVNSWFVYFNTSGFITPGVDTGKNINKRDILVVEPMSKILGLPTIFTLHGDKKNNGRIIVGQMPDNPYACQMRYQREHPFNIPYSNVLQAQNDSSLANKLGQSTVYMPNDWTEIIVYASAEKICDDIGMSEVGQLYHQKLYGYKDKYGSTFPGLITVRQTQQERQSERTSRALRPFIRRYTG